MTVRQSKAHSATRHRINRAKNSAVLWPRMQRLPATIPAAVAPPSIPFYKKSHHSIKPMMDHRCKLNIHRHQRLVAVHRPCPFWVILHRAAWHRHVHSAVAVEINHQLRLVRYQVVNGRYVIVSKKELRAASHGSKSHSKSFFYSLKFCFVCYLCVCVFEHCEQWMNSLCILLQQNFLGNCKPFELYSSNSWNLLSDFLLQIGWESTLALFISKKSHGFLWKPPLKCSLFSRNQLVFCHFIHIISFLQFFTFLQLRFLCLSVLYYLDQECNIESQFFSYLVLFVFFSFFLFVIEFFEL